MSFNGKYERVSTKNMEQFLTAMEANEVMKKFAMDSSPIMEVRHGITLTIVILEFCLLQ